VSFEEARSDFSGALEAAQTPVGQQSGALEEGETFQQGAAQQTAPAEQQEAEVNAA
jgi:hypothetical protein